MINEDGEEFKNTRDAIYAEEDKILDDVLEMKDIDQVPLLTKSSIGFNRDFIRKTISINFWGQLEQVVLTKKT